MAQLRLQGRISSSRPNFVFRAQFRLQGPSFVFRSLEASAMCLACCGSSSSGRTSSSGRISSSRPNFVFSVPNKNRNSSSQEFRLQGDFRLKFRLRAQFELQLLVNNFVFKRFGTSASGGGRNRDPASRVNALPSTLIPSTLSPHPNPFILYFLN